MPFYADSTKPQAMNQDFLREAIQLSLEKMEAGEGGPLGAVIVRNGEIVEKAWNRVTTWLRRRIGWRIERQRGRCR
jgi:tRNA(Arg) A34 adenosine deaminase TadA